MAERVNISGDRYQWAIERAGLSVANYIVTHPNIALSEWMEGEKQPTVRQLEGFAKSVNVPFGFLFLDNVPEEKIPIPVFRGDAGRYDHFNLNVYDTVGAIQLRQDWLEDYLIDNDIELCQFVGKVDISTPLEKAVKILREALGMRDKWAFNLKSTEEAVNIMTEMLENAGVFVAYNGVVGNNTHRPLPVSECRGFALVNEVAPYIFVNSADAPAAQLFTLAHEATHILLGVSAGHAEADTLTDDTVENYCDKVSAEFLVPAKELREIWKGDAKQCAKRFKVSDLVIYRRAHDLGLVSDKQYKEFWNEYINRPIQLKHRNSGGSFYKTSVKRVGKLFAIHVKNAVRTNQLAYTSAFRLTGLYGKTYTKFMNDHV